MSAPTEGPVYTEDQRATAAFAAGAVRIAALWLMRVRLESNAHALFNEHDLLVEIAGVTFANDAARRGPDL